jgi:hypothetical protein
MADAGSRTRGRTVPDPSLCRLFAI